MALLEKQMCRRLAARCASAAGITSACIVYAYVYTDIRSYGPS